LISQAYLADFKVSSAPDTSSEDFLMASESDTFLTRAGRINSSRQIRPTRVAILHGSRASGSNVSNEEIHDALTRLFVPLNARIVSVQEMTQAGISDLLTSQAYDVVGLIGEASEFDFVLRRKGVGYSPRLRLRGGNVESDLQRESESIILAFAPNFYFKDVKNYLKISDAVVFCDVTERDWPQEIAKVVYHFFESLVVPSMLNIDIADVKHIAKGIGLAFNISDDSNKKIIARLPKSCLVARSALLHFSCDPDVHLKEVYSISKAIALKKGIADFDLQINTHADAKKVIRKVNVKMGIRIRDRIKKEFGAITPSCPALTDSKRISLTAILFGL
jgi:hypothetical protein